jgi:DNA repair exonuclease SbcCD ATPase subunit
MIFRNITVTNFLSFKELNYSFINEPLLVQGENLSEDSQESNGSGKSNLQYAIEYSLFKSTSKEEVTDIDLLFFGEKESKLSLEIHCPIRNQTMIINRKIKAKISSELEVLINGAVQSQLATVLDGGRFIIEWLGISKEDLQNYFIVNKERYKSFFSSSNTDKMKMINRFSNAKLIDGIDKEVQTEVQILEGHLSVLKDSKTSMISKVKTLQEQVGIELNRDLKKEIAAEIDEIENYIELSAQEISAILSTIDSFKNSIPINEKLILHLNEDILVKQSLISSTEKSLIKLNEIDLTGKYLAFDEKFAQIASKQSKIREQRVQLIKNKREVESILDEIERNIKGAVKCPKCSHEFLIGDPDVDIQEEKLSKVDTEAVLNKTQTQIQTVTEQSDKLNLEEASINQDKSLVDQEESDLSRRKREIRKSMEQIEAEIKALNLKVQDYQKSNDSISYSIEKRLLEIKNLELTIKNYNAQIDQIKLKQIDLKRIELLKDQMKEEGVKLNKTNKDIRQKKIIIFETSQWIYNFKKFNMYLANQSLKIIQGYCNKFLQELRSDIQVRWEGVKLLADGKLKEEIAAYVIRDNEQRKFGSFSGGERARMEISMIFTLQQMINKTNKWGGLDFLSIDEVLESADSRGISDIMNSLSKLERTILMTTHVVSKTLGSNTLLIRKVHGVSQIIN